MDMDMKRIILKIRILGMIKKGKMYPYALIKEFESSGFCRFFGPTIKNDTYNSLKVLEKTGYIKMTAKMGDGKVKNYYSITSSGSMALKQLGKMMKSTLKDADKILR